jgi:hypothetical protein
LTADDLLEQYRRLAGRSPKPNFMRLFVTSGGRAALHPIAEDFLFGEQLRLPAGVKFISSPDTGEEDPPHIRKLFEELSGIVSGHSPDALPLVIALRGEPGSGRRKLLSKIAGSVGCALLRADISKAPNIDDIFLAADIYGCIICLEKTDELVSEIADRAGLIFAVLESGENLHQSSEYTLIARDMPKAARAESRGALSDLIIPSEQMRQLRELCLFITGRGAVYEKWGKSLSWGRGISILFYGAPGTGKTMAASALAEETGLPLMRADISQLISKYIGETQKNIGRIFDEAAKSDCILFFDEADSLFARRSDAADAQDKYANAETAYLLQRMERHDGSAS